MGDFYYMAYIQTKSNQRIKDYTGFKKEYIETKNQESFILDYYKDYDFKHIKFLKQ